MPSISKDGKIISPMEEQPNHGHAYVLFSWKADLAVAASWPWQILVCSQPLASTSIYCMKPEKPFLCDAVLLLRIRAGKTKKSNSVKGSYFTTDASLGEKT